MSVPVADQFCRHKRCRDGWSRYSRHGQPDGGDCFGTCLNSWRVKSFDGQPPHLPKENWINCFFIVNKVLNTWGTTGSKMKDCFAHWWFCAYCQQIFIQIRILGPPRAPSCTHLFDFKAEVVKIKIYFDNIKLIILTYHSPSWLWQCSKGALKNLKNSAKCKV